MCVFSPHSGAITVLSLLMLMSSIASQALCVCVCVCVRVFTCVSPPQEERLTGDCDCTPGRFRLAMSLLVSTGQISDLSLPIGV